MATLLQSCGTAASATLLGFRGVLNVLISIFYSFGNRAYELEIEHPIRNAVVGDFLQLVLIQVQKQKVDVERAMVKLDKLLRQNELNFEIMAAFPAMIALFITYRIVTRETHPYEKAYAAIRLTLREIAVLLNKNNGVSKAVKRRFNQGEEPVSLPMSFEHYGEIVSKVLHLAKQSTMLPEEERKWFTEDIMELSSDRYKVSQRLATVTRMYGTYGFLTGVSR